ncbi:hypothetical protein [Halospeciosus flavus]|uniref:hypothetical protein n=1 Tax=Halospeciosus flavus TaxID=3032283 RepID=UPI0036238ED5
MSTMTGDDTEETEESADNYSNSRVYNWLDDRLGVQDKFLGKAFPEDEYASFLLGEVSLFSFAILVLTGTFLGSCTSRRSRPSSTSVRSRSTTTRRCRPRSRPSSGSRTTSASGCSSVISTTGRRTCSSPR